MANKPLDTSLLDRAIVFAVRAHAKDPKDHEWHYQGLADALSELRDTFAYKEFEQLINQVFPLKP